MCCGRKVATCADGLVAPSDLPSQTPAEEFYRPALSVRPALDATSSSEALSPTTRRSRLSPLSSGYASMVSGRAWHRTSVVPSRQGLTLNPKSAMIPNCLSPMLGTVALILCVSGTPALAATLSTGLTATLGGVAGAAQARPPKSVKVIVVVDSEGPEGLSLQAAQDLSATELNQLRNLIGAEVGKLPGHSLVTADDKDDAVGLAVVAAQVRVGGARFILLSSAITISKTDGRELLFSHDVIPAPTLAGAAKAVAGYLASVELRGTLGLPQ